METDKELFLPGDGPVLEPLVEIVENDQEPFHMELPEGRAGMVIQVTNNTDRAMIIHLPNGIDLRGVKECSNVLDEGFIRAHVKMADVPRDLRSCFACGRFVPKSRWRLDLSRKRLPICATCDEYGDW